MGGKRRIFGRILRLAGIAAVFLAATCCMEMTVPKAERVSVTVRLSETDALVRSGDNVEMTDICLLVFNQDGTAEKCIYPHKGTTALDLDLISGKTYSFYALAGFGYRVYATHISEMQELTFHIDNPRDLRTQIPMSGHADEITISSETSVRIPMKRLAARISIEMDRSRIDEDVIMEVTGIRIGNCPSQAKAFGRSRVNKSEDCFTHGYSLYGPEVSLLNIADSSGHSGRISLFMLENMQGKLSDIQPDEDRDKVFEEGDPRRNTCSYIEIQLRYLSRRNFSSEGPLIYRFYLGGSLTDVDIERNCHYRICISPEGSGLTEDGWRVDKRYMHEFGQSTFAFFPESYIRGDIGDTLHLYCEFYPPYTPFEIDMEELEFDRENGIYDYFIDEDGQGVRLILKGPGTGIVYMKAGDPVNEAAMWVVEVNMPQAQQIPTDTLQYMNLRRTSTAPEFRQRPDIRLHHQLPVPGRSPSQPPE